MAEIGAELAQLAQDFEDCRKLLRMLERARAVVEALPDRSDVED